MLEAVNVMQKRGDSHVGIWVFAVHHLKMTEC